MSSQADAVKILASEVQRMAVCAAENGLSVIAVRGDGSKAPVGQWRQQQQVHINPTDAAELFHPDNGHCGYGIVAGAVSCDLEVYDFDDEEAFDELQKVMMDTDLSRLYDRIASGCVVKSPNGYHVYVRVEVAGKSTKLSWSAEGDKARVETRGEGGYVVGPGSGGAVHPTGKPYLLLQGGFDTIPLLSEHERDELVGAVRALCRKPHPTTKRVPRATPGDVDTDDRPGDRYNRSASWVEVLEPHDWTRVGPERDGRQYWCRPGKPAGVSAVTGGEYDVLCVFSTSTVFESDKSYTKFGAYAMLNHGGDHAAAGSALAATNPQLPANRDSLDGEDTPPFPTDVFPSVVARFINEQSGALGCDPGMVGTAVLGVLGGAIGCTLRAEVKPGFREGAMVYAAVVGESGSKKSPAMRAAVQPLRTLDTDRTQVLKMMSERGLLPKGADASPEIRLVVDDVTMECLAVVHQKNPDRLVYLCDEGAGLFGSMNQYKKGGGGSDEAKFCTLWEGDPLTVDRKGEKGVGQSIRLPRSGVSVVTTIQPGLLADAMTGGRLESGFMARFLFCYAKRRQNTWSDETASPEAVCDYYTTVFTIALATQGVSGPKILPFSHESLDVYRDFYNSWYVGVDSLTDQSPLRAPYVKMERYVVRFALILSVVSGNTDGPIEAKWVHAGIRLAHYYAGQAHRVYAMKQSRGESKSVKSVEQIVNDGTKPVTPRDLVANHRGRFPTTAVATEALNDLVGAGGHRWVDVPSTGKGGRPTRGVRRIA